MRIIVIMLIIACTKNNFIYDNKYKNDIEYYFNNLDRLNESTIPYVIEKAEDGDKKALFLYIFLFYKYPNNVHLASKLELLKEIDNIIEYLYNNNELKALGLLLQAGTKGISDPNVNKIIEYYNRTLDINNFGKPKILAASSLGHLYKNGVKDLLEPNINKAIEYYIKATNLGSSYTANDLGLLYENGIEDQLEPNIEKAIEYYTKAIDMFNSHAAVNLGYLYLRGAKGQLEPNIEMAIKYYNAAFNMGDYNAEYRLQELYNNLIEKKMNISISEGIKYAFDLYNKYGHKHHIINQTFALNDKMEEDNDIEVKILVGIYTDNIRECYGVILEHKIANDINSTISSFKHNPINNELFISCNYICTYLESLLDILVYFDNSNFLIDFIRLKDSSNFNNNENDYVNIINIEGNEYICLGLYEIYKKLVDIINGKEQLLNHKNKLMDTINNSNGLYNALNEITNIESQLYDILICSSHLRNDNFKNKYKGLFNS